MNVANKKFFGKYRGIVTDYKDPLTMGRIRAQVPDVLGGEESGWAMPCVPFAGKGIGFLGLPAIGSGVWIEFEQGDPDYPIWSGTWWLDGSDVPAVAKSAEYDKTVMVTSKGNQVILDDSSGSGGITLKIIGGQTSITLTSQGGEESITVTAAGTLTLKTATNQKIVLSTAGIEIDNGLGASIKMEGPQVSINQDALTII